MTEINSNYNKIKLLGEIMSCDAAMKILRYNVTPHYPHNISTNLHLRTSLVIHHLNKMVLLGVVDVIDSDIRKTVFKKNKRIKSLYRTKPDVLEKLEELI